MNNAIGAAWRYAMLCVLTLLALVGCNDDESFPTSGGDNALKVESIALSLAGESQIPNGLNGLVVATATYEDGSQKNVSPDVTWSLSNDHFIENGLTEQNEQRFKANGEPDVQTTISATLADIESQNSVTLNVSSAVVEALNVTPPAMSGPAGLTVQFYANAVLSDGRVLDVTSEEALQWQVEGLSVDNGRVTPTAEQVGQTLTVNASATINEQSETAQAALTVSDLTVKSVNVQPLDGAIWNADLAIDESREMVAIATMSDDTTQTLNNADVTWAPTETSGNVSMNIVDSHAYAKGLKTGQGDVRASFGGRSGAFLFNVFEQTNPEGIIVGTEDQLRKGASMHLNFVSKGVDGSVVDLTSETTWRVSDETYVHMEGNTLIATPIGGYDPSLDYPDSQVITVFATKGALTDEYQVSIVDAAATTLSISPSSDTVVAYGNNLQMEAFVTYSDGVQENVTANPSMHWKAQDKANAFFSSVTPGLLETGAPETLTVGGTFDGLSASPSISVTVNDRQPASLSLSPTSGYSALLPQQLTLTLAYDDGSTEKLAFDSSVSVVVTAWDGDAAATPSINAEGIFYATMPGKVTLKATKALSGRDPLSTTETFDVADVKLISSLAISPKEAELAPGQSQSFTVYSIDVDGGATLLLPEQVTYLLDDAAGTGSTLDPSTGIVTAGSPGAISLKATMKNVTAEETVDGQIPTQTAPITIVAKALQSLDIQLPENLTLIPGQTVALSALGRYNDDSSAPLSNDTVEWSKTGTAFDIIDANSDGVNDTLKAIAPGTGAITATYKADTGIVDTVDPIVVNNATITTLAISPDISVLPEGFSQKFEAFAVADTGDRAKLDSGQVSWSITAGSGAVSGRNNGDGTYTVESLTAGESVTITASLNAAAFPDFANNSITQDEHFDTVVADITDVVIEPLDGSTVAIDVPYRLRAEAVQNNGELFDATSLVGWSLSSTDYEIADVTDGKSITFKSTSAPTATMTATPNSDAVWNGYTTPATSTVTVLQPSVAGLLVTPQKVTINTKSTTQLRAYAYYTYNQAPVDVTDSVTWTVEGTGSSTETYGVTVETTGDPSPGLVSSSTTPGVVNVVAKDSDGNQGSSEVTVNFVLLVCGPNPDDADNIDDTDPTNATGACLKVATDAGGNWFTSSPSKATMDIMGYGVENTATNTGYTYAGTTDESGITGPTGGEFARFRQDGDGVVIPGGGDDTGAGVDGQFDRWCQDLAAKNFAGKATWRRPTLSELEGLYNHNGNMWTAHGWPTRSYYRTSTTDALKAGVYKSVGLTDGETTVVGSQEGQLSASCIAKPPTPSICGGAIDDTDKSNASGMCLKVATDAAGHWFTSTPSKAVMDEMGYTQEDSDDNSGDTYGSLRLEDGTYGPNGIEFALFRQDGSGVVTPGVGDDANAGIDGQLDRWCQKLNAVEFGGKSDWRRPTKDELVGLYNDAGDSLWGARGWPTLYRYWSSTVSGSGYYNVVLGNGNVVSNNPYSEFYASCVSNP